MTVQFLSRRTADDVYREAAEERAARDAERVARAVRRAGAEALAASPDELPPAIADRYLGVIEGRCLTRQNGASWQLDCVRRLESGGMDRAGALREMLRVYLEHAEANEPVHTWALPAEQD